MKICSRDREGARLLRPGERAAYSLFGRRESADQDTSFVYQVNQPGAPCEDHAHDLEQWMFIYKGRVRFVIDGEEQVAGPGDLVYVPRNALHRHETLGRATAEILVIDHWPHDSQNQLGWD